MTGSTKRWFEVAAFTITITAALGIVALALRLFLGWPHVANGLAVATSIFTALFCVFAGIAVKRRASE
jgi:hypothetical protein